MSAVMFLERVHASGPGCSITVKRENIRKPYGTFHWILDKYLSSEKSYPPFAQLGPVL